MPGSRRAARASRWPTVASSPTTAGTPTIPRLLHRGVRVTELVRPCGGPGVTHRAGGPLSLDRAHVRGAGRVAGVEVVVLCVRRPGRQRRRATLAARPSRGRRGLPVGGPRPSRPWRMGRVDPAVDVIVGPGTATWPRRCARSPVSSGSRRLRRPSEWWSWPAPTRRPSWPQSTWPCRPSTDPGGCRGSSRGRSTSWTGRRGARPIVAASPRRAELEPRCRRGATRAWSRGPRRPSRSQTSSRPSTSSS